MKATLGFFNRHAIIGMLVLTPLIAAQSVFAQDEIHEKLQPLSMFVGKTWVGDFGGDDKAVDVARWEWALQGKAARITHSLNEGEYAGETMIVWDSSKESLVYFYFTTAGFYTSGTMEIDGQSLTAYEEVVGDINGITAVRSESSLQEDGSMRGVSQYLVNGEWTEGRTVVYREDATAVLKM